MADGKERVPLFDFDYADQLLALGMRVGDRSDRAPGAEPADSEYYVPSGIRRPIGEILRDWRERAGKSLRDVQSDFKQKFTASYVSQLENGKVQSPRVETVLQLARYYGIPYAEVQARFNDVVASAFFDEADPTIREFKKRADEIERVFAFVSKAPDFPRPDLDVPESVFWGMSPAQKALVILMYEHATGLTVLPRWVLKPFEVDEVEEDGGRTAPRAWKQEEVTGE